LERLEARTKTLEEAHLLGFPLAGVAPAAPPDSRAYDAWLTRGFHGDMGFLAAHRDVKARPSLLLAPLRSVLVLGVPYRYTRPPEPEGLFGAVAGYAWGRDYHNVLRKRLRQLQRRLSSIFPGLESRSFVDADPVWERWWAEQAGLGRCGFSGTLLPTRGSPATFLCGLLLSVDLGSTEPVPATDTSSDCASCGRCVSACPTRAIVEPGVVDARRCISYLTIENRAGIPEGLRRATGARLLGCDICTESCPRAACGPPPDPAFAPVNAWVDLAEILGASDVALEERYAGTALRRPGAVGLQRNAAVALGNLCGRPDLAQEAHVALARAARHPSELVRTHVAWAASEWGFRDVARAAFEAQPGTLG
jgi:epoxyqueuosine reductase